MGRSIFFIIGILLLAPWPVAYAYESGTEASPVRIEAAAPAEKPTWDTPGKAVTSVTPGALFYLDCRRNPADAGLTLYLVNPDELVHHYRYLNLAVALYIKNEAGEWERASGEHYLTLKSVEVSLRLPAYAEYKLNVDGGCLYCFGSDDGEGTPAPRFYLRVE